MRRRDFIAVVGSAAVGWSSIAPAQPGLRRVTVVLGFEQDDQEGQKRLAAFTETLGRLGWSDGRNIGLDVRWAGGNVANYKAVAKEVAAASPDVITAMTNPFVAQLQPLTKTIPIVFIQVSDSIGAGFVSSVTRPGGKITGFENFQPEIGGKWLSCSRRPRPP